MLNYIKKNFFKSRDQGVNLSGDLASYFGSINNYHGLQISAESILGNPLVYRAVNLVASNCAKMPIHIYRHTENGREKATALTQYYLLNKQPHELYSRSQFIHTMVANCLIFGNSYAWIERNQFATPQQLYILDPRNVWPEIQLDGSIIYRLTINNTNIVAQAQDMIHMKGLSLNGLVGLPLLSILSNAYGYGLNLQKAGNCYFKNNMRPSYSIELGPNVKTPEKLLEFKRLWVEQQSGNNTNAPAFLANGTKVVPFSSTNDASNLISNMEHDITVVAACIGINPSRLGSKNNTSYSSLEMETQNFLGDIDGWLIQMEAEFENKLLSEAAKYNMTHYIEFDRDALIKIDTKTQSEILIAEFNNGIINFEEMRAKKSMNIDKGNTGEWRRPSNILLESEAKEKLDLEKQAMEKKQNESINPSTPGNGLQSDPSSDGADNNRSKTEINTRSTEVDTKLKMMTLLTMDRLLHRLSKSKDEIESHRSIFVQNLSPFDNANEFVDNLFSEISKQDDKYKYISELKSDDLITQLIA